MAQEGNGAAAEKEPPKMSEKRRSQIVAAAVRLFSRKGYFQTTIEDIAREANVSKGLIYLYFKDKNDVLFFTLRFVLERIERQAPALLERAAHPLLALRNAFRFYCAMADNHKLEMLLAYRSTMDLLPEQRLGIKVEESRNSRVFRNALEACIHGGLMRPVNTDIMTYQYMMYAHTWAIKNWAFRDQYRFEDFLAEGEKILIEPFLTESGQAKMADQTGLLDLDALRHAIREAAEE
jgi:AcrR family transcriptional regulator